MEKRFVNITRTESPKISILIPTFNREKYIEECIQSAINQTFDDYEIVVVDNSSTDRTWEIINEYALKYKNIRAFRNNTNVGPVKNWQRCINEARGAYCKFLFSDDLLFPNCLHELYNSIIRSNYCFVFSQVKTGNSIQNSVINYDQFHSTNVTRNEYFAGLLSGIAPVSPGAVLIERALLQTCLKFAFQTATPRNFITNGAGPDVMIMLSAFASNRPAGYVNEPLSFFRTHNESITILNDNNEVAFGYMSVLSLYAKQNFSFVKWVQTISKLWLKLIYKTKSIVSPIDFFIEFEGTGSLKELVIFILVTPCVVISELNRRVKLLFVKNRSLKFHG